MGNSLARIQHIATLQIRLHYAEEVRFLPVAVVKDKGKDKGCHGVVDRGVRRSLHL